MGNGVVDLIEYFSGCGIDSLSYKFHDIEIEFNNFYPHGFLDRELEIEYLQQGVFFQYAALQEGSHNSVEIILDEFNVGLPIKLVP